MDLFGIGTAITGVIQVYLRASRQTGRTTSLVESAKDGDRIVFTNTSEAERVRRLCKKRGIEVECSVIDPKSPQRIFERGTPKGRTILDHSWVEEYYINAIEEAKKDIDRIERESSGYGMAHIETAYCAREITRWRG